MRRGMWRGRARVLQSLRVWLMRLVSRRWRYGLVLRRRRRLGLCWLGLVRWMFGRIRDRV